jgi:hypothetical protein
MLRRAAGPLWVGQFPSDSMSPRGSEVSRWSNPRLWWDGELTGRNHSYRPGDGSLVLLAAISPPVPRTCDSCSQQVGPALEVEQLLGVHAGNLHPIRVADGSPIKPLFGLDHVLVRIID